MIYFNSYPGHLAAAIAVVLAVAAVALIYHLLRRQISRPLSLFLKLARLLVVLCILVILCDPVMMRQVEGETTLDNVIICLDNSRSMSVKDREQKSRFERAREVILTHLLPSGKKIENKLLLFSGATSETEDLNTAEPDGKATDLVQVLRLVHTDRNTPEAVFLLSDGNSTRGGDPVEFVRSFGGSIPIHTIGIGTAKSVPDAGILSVTGPQIVTEGDKIPLSVTVFQRGLAGSEAMLIVERDNEPLVVRKFTMPKREFERMNFVIPAERVGWNSYRVSIRAPDAGKEFSQENNTALLTVRVAARDPIKVLYLETSLRWTARFMQQALSTDKDILLSFRADIARGMYRKGEKRYFPSSREDLFEYDVVILGNLDKGYLTNSDMAALYDFVAERGGGLAFVGGVDNLVQQGLAGTPLAKLLPVHLDGRSKLEETKPFDITPVITDEGRSHAIIEPLLSEGYLLPEKLRMKWHYAAKPSATVLVRSEENSVPMLLAQRFGRGHVMVSASGFLWKWAFPAEWPKKHEQGLYDQLWRRSVRWLGRNRNTEARFQLHADKSSFGVGEPVLVYCRAKDSRFRPDTKAQVVLKIANEAYEMAPLADKEGTYFARIVGLNEGSHVLSAFISRDDELVGQARAAVSVVDSDEEARRLALNEEVLREIAELSGGTYSSEEKLPDMTELIKNLGSHTGRATKEDRIWDRWLVLMMMVGILSVEWFVRRRKGLA